MVEKETYFCPNCGSINTAPSFGERLDWKTDFPGRTSSMQIQGLKRTCKDRHFAGIMIMATLKNIKKYREKLPKKK